jgi:oligopeptide transport system substrate-binding protein
LRRRAQLALTYLAFNVREPPFDDARVRRAFARVVDRARIARVMFDGKVEPVHGLVPPRLPGGDLPAIAHDAAAAAAARQLLADSRHAGQVPRVRLFDPGGGMGSMLREVFQRDLGVTVDVISAPWNDYLLGLERREYPAYILSWSADYPDAQSFVESMFKSDSAENHSSYANPRVDSLLEQASRETDPAARAALYRQVQAIILDDAVAVPLYFGISYLLVKPHVKGLAVTPMGIVGLERAWVER